MLWVLLGFTRLYWFVCLQNWVLLDYIGLYYALLGFAGLYRVRIGFYGMVLSFAGGFPKLYWVLLGYAVLSWVLTGWRSLFLDSKHLARHSVACRLSRRP